MINSEKGTYFFTITADATGGTAIPLPAGFIAGRATLTLATGQIRYRYDGGGGPTATEGHVMDVGTGLVVEGHDNIANFRVISTTGTLGVLSVTVEAAR